MATKTVTIDTGEWVYPDKNGVTHTVTNAQTFTFELTDGGASAVTYQQDHATSVTCTDGSRLTMRPGSEGNLGGVSGTNTGARRVWGPGADALDATTVYSQRGELRIECPSTGVIQIWKPATVLIDDVDTPTAISGVWEDQFGNRFSWTTVTVS